MRGMKKFGVTLLAAGLAFALSACAQLTGLDAQALMSPPKSTADREAIYALMRGEDADVSLVYPKNGDYRSAVISRDLDGDSVQEVIGFCLNAEGGGTRVQVFSKADGTWRSLARFTSTANQVDKVFFGDLTGDGTEEIIVGWGDPSTMTATVSVYTLSNGIVHELPMSAVAYSEMLLTDFDADETKELFVLDMPTQAPPEGGEEPAGAPLGRLYRFDGDSPYVAQTAPLDAGVTRYTGAVFAQINSWRFAVVLDGVKADGRMTTQVIGYDELTELLSAPLAAAGAENPTDRTSAVSVTSRDINADGILEIPTATRIETPAEETVPDSTSFVVTWNTYSLTDNVFTAVAESVVNSTENYLVLFPQSETHVACRNNAVTRTATFFSYIMENGGGIRKTGDLFSISVYADDAWSREKAGKNEIYLNSMGGRVYVLSTVPDGPGADSEIVREAVEGFKILSE